MMTRSRTMAIDALDIWEEIAESKACQETQNFYESRGNLSPGPHGIRNKILERGKTNFDETATGMPDEKSWYKAVAYMGDKGYMGMHIVQNLVLLNAYIQLAEYYNKKLLFVDYGCGPMTSGLVLAEILSQTSDGYKDNITYVGIDTSQNMCDVAWSMNAKYKLFDKFVTINEFDIHKKTINNLDKFDAAILCFSYVLSPNTFNRSRHSDIVEAEIKFISTEWLKFLMPHKMCTDMNILYANPIFRDDESRDADTNWKYMKGFFANVFSSDWNFNITSDKFENYSVNHRKMKLSGQMQIGMIEANRKG